MLFLHAGNHIGMTSHGLVAHLLEPDHIAFALITFAVGLVCYRAGRRAEARVSISKDRAP